MVQIGKPKNKHLVGVFPKYRDSNISGWFWEDIPVPNFQGISRSQKKSPQRRPVNPGDHGSRSIEHIFPTFTQILQSQVNPCEKTYVSEMFTLQTFPMSSWIQLHGGAWCQRRKCFPHMPQPRLDMLCEATSTQEIRKKKKDTFLGHLQVH